MKSIIFTGPKHCGKTSAARAFSQLCSCNFLDVDEMIFQRTGKTCRELYIQSPEVFLNAESQAVAAIPESDCVIAAGGGIIDNKDAIAILKELKVFIIYLNVSADCAWERIIAAADGELPPFLRTENPRETHRELHERRIIGYYRLADIIIEAEDKSPEMIAAEISKRLRQV